MKLFEHHHTGCMKDKPSKNILCPEAREQYLLTLSPTLRRKQEIGENIFQKLDTKYPQASKAHQPAFFSFMFQRYMVGAFLVLLIAASAVAVEEKLELNPGEDNVPYVTRKVVENVKYAFLGVVSEKSADKYNQALIARRTDELSNLISREKDLNVSSIVIVVKDLAGRLGQYSKDGGLVAPNETRYALHILKETKVAVKNAEDTLGKHLDDPKAEEALSLVRDVDQRGNEILRAQAEAKLAEAKKANENHEAVLAAEQDYRVGDFLAALEKLESPETEATDPRGIVQGDQVVALNQEFEEATNDVGQSGGTSTSSQAVVVGSKPSNTGKKDHGTTTTPQQIEYAVGLEL